MPSRGRSAPSCVRPEGCEEPRGLPNTKTPMRRGGVTLYPDCGSRGPLRRRPLEPRRRRERTRTAEGAREAPTFLRRPAAVGGRGRAGRGHARGRAACWSADGAPPKATPTRDGRVSHEDPSQTRRRSGGAGRRRGCARGRCRAALGGARAGLGGQRAPELTWRYRLRRTPSRRARAGARARSCALGAAHGPLAAWRSAGARRSPGQLGQHKSKAHAGQQSELLPRRPWQQSGTLLLPTQMPDYVTESGSDRVAGSDMPESRPPMQHSSWLLWRKNDGVEQHAHRAPRHGRGRGRGAWPVRGAGNERRSVRKRTPLHGARERGRRRGAYDTRWRVCNSLRVFVLLT